MSKETNKQATLIILESARQFPAWLDSSVIWLPSCGTRGQGSDSSLCLLGEESACIVLVKLQRATAPPEEANSKQPLNIFYLENPRKGCHKM